MNFSFSIFTLKPLVPFFFYFNRENLTISDAFVYDAVVDFKVPNENQIEPPSGILDCLSSTPKSTALSFCIVNTSSQNIVI